MWECAYPLALLFSQGTHSPLHLAKHYSATIPAQEHPIVPQPAPLKCVLAQTQHPTPDSRGTVPACWLYAHHSVQNCRGQAHFKIPGWTYSYIHTYIATDISTIQRTWWGEYIQRLKLLATRNDMLATTYLLHSINKKPQIMIHTTVTHLNIVPTPHVSWWECKNL